MLPRALPRRMPEWETKLKLGRKLEGVDSETASANQVSALFRFTPEGEDKHVSLSIESDRMTPHDVIAVFGLLHERGVLRSFDCKTWVNQPQASEKRFGKTAAWSGVDLGEAVALLERNLPVRDPGASAAAPDARAALAKFDEVEKKLAELKRELKGA